MMKPNEFIKEWLIPPGIWKHLSAIKNSPMPQRILLNTDEISLLERSKKLKDRHQGTRCFILGAGSSVSSQDIRKLSGDIVISVSNTFVHPDFSIIRPRYHVLPPLLKYHGGLHTEEKFVGWLSVMEIATCGADMFMHIGDRQMIENNRLFTKQRVFWVDYTEKWDANPATPVNLACIPPIGSVSELALTVAVHLGFDQIYLIGLDHDWFNGLHVYFYDHKKEHALRPNESDLRFIDSEFQMRRHADIFRKYKYLNALRHNIYNANANANHYLDVFPKVVFDKLFIETKGP